MEFYNIPLKLSDVVKGKIIDDEVEIRKSIHQNIALILKSFTMSYRFDPSFGSVIKKHRASTPPQGVNERKWRESIKNDIQLNLEDMLKRYEKRIQVKDVIVDLQIPKRHSGEKETMVRVKVNGQLSIGKRENFNYPDSEIADDAKEVFPLMIPIGK